MCYSFTGALTHDDLLQHMRKPLTQKDVNALNVTTYSQFQVWRHSMESVPPPLGLPLMSCVLMAGLVSPWGRGPGH